jgi:hypothetical protein
MRLNALLGYHMPGTHHYVTALPEGNAFLGQGDERFLTSDAFIGLVTAVHEHYHLMQELLQGFSWWRQDTLDRFTRAATTVAPLGSKRIPQLETPDATTKQMTFSSDPASFARAWSFELANIDRGATSPLLTRNLLEMEVMMSEWLAPFLSPEAFELTTLDLMECHAALLTELYISKLIAEHPEKFHRKVLSDHESLFRVAQLPEGYQRPLQVLLRILEAGHVKLGIGSDRHPMYQGIRHAPIYLLLAFLLDYALHLPPDPSLLYSATRDAAAAQDTHPPFRFINLGFLWLFGLTGGSSDTKKLLSSERRYYSDAAPYLAEEVNRMHAGVRARGAPATFFGLQETTNMWREKFDDPPLGEWFPLYDAIRRASWRRRFENPAVWIDLQPLNFDLSIQLPRVMIAGEQLQAFPYFADTEGGLSSANVADRLAEMSRPYYETLMLGQWQKRNDIPATMYPMRFIDEMISREMLYGLATSILFTGTMRCPLTEGLGRFVPCAPRTGACERITEFSSLPREGCALRDSGARFGGVDRYQSS